MIKEQVLKALRDLGFIPEEVNVGYMFKYEGLTLIYAYDMDDEDDDEEEEAKCVLLLAPHIFDISDDNRTAVLEAMVKLCGRVKYVQPHIMFEDQVWLDYSHFTGDNEVTADLIGHMITAMAYANTIFSKIINGEDNDD